MSPPCRGSLPVFAFIDLPDRGPTGIRVFNGIGTMWRGQRRSRRRCFLVCFLITFLGWSEPGLLLSSPQLTSTSPTAHSVVAHFRLRAVRDLVCAPFAGPYFWFREDDGRLLDEPWQAAFRLKFIGFQHDVPDSSLAGDIGMPLATDYLPTDDSSPTTRTEQNNYSTTIGAFILACRCSVRLEPSRAGATAEVVTVDDLGIRQLAGSGAHQLPTAVGTTSPGCR